MNDELDLPRLQRKTLISDEINFDWTDRIAWRHWLRVSLADYLLQEKGAASFSPFKLNVALLSPHGAIRQLYDRLGQDLGSRPQEAFKLAVTATVEHLEPYRQHIPIFRELVDLGREIGAGDLLTVLPLKLSPKCWPDLTETEDGQALVRDSLFAAFDMPIRSSVGCIYRLWELHDHTALTGQALESLCRVDPHHFAEHFRNFAAPLAVMFKAYRVPQRSKNALAKQILDDITVGILAEHEHKLWNDNYRLNSDKWFHDALTTGKDRVLVVEEDPLDPRSHIIRRIDKTNAPAAKLRRLKGSKAAPARRRLPVVVILADRDPQLFAGDDDAKQLIQQQKLAGRQLLDDHIPARN
jgi:hypothetical protein